MARLVKRAEKNISEAVINRLPRYFRFLSELKR
ncbi:MAG: redox-sensing transcriptional repressor Rex, partial [Clostridia bacterium]|nr:redox-sensing transcriptional repressor Rex [Clostridia bacterium]